MALASQCLNSISSLYVAAIVTPIGVQQLTFCTRPMLREQSFTGNVQAGNNSRTLAHQCHTRDQVVATSAIGIRMVEQLLGRCGCGTCYPGRRLARLTLATLCPGLRILLGRWPENEKMIGLWPKNEMT